MHVYTVNGIDVVSGGKNVTRVKVYSGCPNSKDPDPRIFCMGAGNSQLYYGLTNDASDCVWVNSCNFLLKAIKDEAKDEVTFELYAKYGANARDVFVALTRKPQNMGPAAQISATNPFSGTPHMTIRHEWNGRNPVAAGGEGQVYVVQPLEGDNVRYVETFEGQKTFPETPNVDIRVFKASLTEFTGPVSPTVIIVQTYRDPGKTSAVDFTSSAAPAILLWGTRYPPLSEVPSSGFPLWAIIVIIVVVLLLLLIIAAVCWYASTRNRKRA